MDIVISDLKIETNIRYWERSVIDSILNFAHRKYGHAVDVTKDIVSIKERKLKIASHNSW